MKVKLFIVSYKNDNYLEINLRSLMNSDAMQFQFSIHIINNYTASFALQDFCNNNNIEVIHNYARPNFSTGHLARSWNQCIIHGFQNLKEPDCDLLVLAQDDNFFQQNWLKSLIKHHDKFEFISMGAGDQFHSYLPIHIKKVGLWDERFCNIGYQEADYFLRSYLYNKDKSSINDVRHGRIHNKIINNIIDLNEIFVGGCRNDDRTCESMKYHDLSFKILRAKWGDDFANCTTDNSWNFEKLNNIHNCNITNYIYYPYFEKDINYTDKNYIV